MMLTEDLSPGALELMEQIGGAQRGRPPVSTCKRGHDQTADGARNGSGKCRACQAIRDIAKRAKQ